MGIALNQGIEFLQRKFKLNSDPTVISSAKREQLHAEKIIPENDYVTRIQHYLDRITKLIITPKSAEGHPETFSREQRNLDTLKHMLYDQVIIKPEEVPENYFRSIIQRHKDEGRPIEELPLGTKADLITTLIDDQKESLDQWVNEFTSQGTQHEYQDWFKYYAFRQVLVMGKYDKKSKKFGERSKSGKNVTMFPELRRDALSFVQNALLMKQGIGQSFGYGQGILPEEKTAFEAMLREGDPHFASLYAWAIDKINPISDELLQQAEGNWVTYPTGSDPTQLVESLAEYGTGWCIRGTSMAKQYLQGGDNIRPSDLTVFYSKNENGDAVVPRIVIVEREGIIDEVRGVAEDEHWDNYITDVIDAKLHELPDGPRFKQRVADMQQMTEIYKKSFSIDKKTEVKTYLEPKLTKEELSFLYELDRKIEGFGLNTPDPRIKEIRAKRNPNLEEDMMTIFECKAEQIAHNRGEINENTKAYVGSLVPDIFAKLPQEVEHVYLSFPEKKLISGSLVCESSVIALKQQLDMANINYYSTGKLFRDKPDEFYMNRMPERVDFVELELTDLGFEREPLTEELQARAEIFGLEYCPPEFGPNYALTNLEARLRYIWMQPIYHSKMDKELCVFNCKRDREGVRYLGKSNILGARWNNKKTIDRWDVHQPIIFRRRAAKDK